jgi:hypothetical protein
MPMFSRPKAVLWPKANSVDLYLDKSENNIFSLDLNLWHTCSASELQSLDLLLSQNSVTECTILVPDDIVFTKSFIYDSEITSIDKNEVIGLAESFINFKIHPDFIDYRLIPSSGKTIILAHIFEHSKINTLETNLKSLHLKSYSLKSVSDSIAHIISQKFDGEYFLIFPQSLGEYTLLLAKNDAVYLTSTLKGKELEIQKIINYSKLYFPTLTTKFYIPSDVELDITAQTTLDKTPYDQTALAATFKKASNLPLPVLGLFISKMAPPVIINQADISLKPPIMENKKNILPFIAVFVATTAIASIIIWFVLNKDNSTVIETPVTNVTPTVMVEAPTETPVPTAAEISKKLKLQVLNATDINGQAALLKTKLTNLGFTSIAVGNAKENLTTNQIKIKASQSTASAYFVQSLAGFFDAVPTLDLPATSTYDVVFYIGTKLSTSEESTPAAKISPTAKVTVKPTAIPTE